MVEVRPCVQSLGDKLGTVIHFDSLRRTFDPDDLIQHIGYSFPCDAFIHMQCQAFSAVQVYQGQRSEPFPIIKLITDKVHCPAFVESVGWFH